MGLKIMSQSELVIEKRMNTNHIEKRTENESVQNANKGKVGISSEASVLISNEGQKMFDENGKYGTWMSDEEITKMFGEEKIQKKEKTNFQYGYDKELDSVSSSFKKAFSMYKVGRYAGTGIDYNNIDYSVVDKMAEKYMELKQGIETSYTGNEQEQRLSELDKAYQKTFENHIVTPIRNQIESAMSFYNRGTLVSISGSQKFINQYYSSVGEMGATYKLLDKVNQELTSFSEKKVSQMIANSTNTKSDLRSIVSSIINITGDSNQKAEYALKKE